MIIFLFLVNCTANIEDRTYTRDKQSSPSLVSVSCYTRFIAPNFVATVVKELIYILIKMASSILTLKHIGVLMQRTNNTKFISPIDQRKKGRVVNHHIVDGIWVCIYAMVFYS